ncbi:hypothetical protein ACT4MK_36905 [Bradyrhizobium barranii]|uniref:hypothetical protein n=1 Tax=Bradyrhizobium TaxID=374 RepID=UPI003F219046
MLKEFRAALYSLCLLGISSAMADEVIMRSLDLPGASMEQEITYSPTRIEYERVRDDTLTRLKQGDKTAMVNPGNGPWMRVETTAKIGFAYKGIGVSEGRKHLRQISAAEEALYRYEQKD